MHVCFGSNAIFGCYARQSFHWRAHVQAAAQPPIPVAGRGVKTGRNIAHTEDHVMQNHSTVAHPPSAFGAVVEQLQHDGALAHEARVAARSSGVVRGAG
eukprot:356232-Chlamydomonas_euryale.AAC.36